MNQQPTNQDILTAINTFATDTEHRFQDLETDVEKIKSEMVTKDYLDEKLSDLRGDLVVLVRKEDRKLTALVGVLKEKSVITPNEAQQVLMLEPFPQ